MRWLLLPISQLTLKCFMFLCKNHLPIVNIKEEEIVYISNKIKSAAAAHKITCCIITIKEFTNIKEGYRIKDYQDNAQEVKRKTNVSNLSRQWFSPENIRHLFFFFFFFFCQFILISAVMSSIRRVSKESIKFTGIENKALNDPTHERSFDKNKIKNIARVKRINSNSRKTKIFLKNVP